RQRHGDHDQHGQAAELQRGPVALGHQVESRRRKRTERPKSPWSAWVRKRQYWTVHGRSRPRWARTSSMSAFEASAGIMIWIGSPESLTSAKTTTDTTNIDAIDWTTRPMMKRCIGASALEA